MFYELWIGLSVSIFRLFPVIYLFFIYGCATVPEQATIPATTAKPAELTKPLVKKQQNEDKDSLSPDVLFMLLTAELAGQKATCDRAPNLNANTLIQCDWHQLIFRVSRLDGVVNLLANEFGKPATIGRHHRFHDMPS